jgi:aspartate carbamoyltransferase catalytic subunit
MHILSADQFSPEDIAGIFKSADKMKAAVSTLAGSKKLLDLHKGRQIATLFYQPSTRTRTSFEVAAMKMGVGVVSTENALEASSAAKGETVEDTYQMLNRYHLSAIVMRHNEVGAAQRAASVSETPVINAGDGSGEHPTQSLLDAYTIHNNLGRLKNLNIVIGGDVERSRTIRSLVDLLSKYPGNSFSFIVMPGLTLRGEIVEVLKKKGIPYKVGTDIKEFFKDADIVYWNRIQREYLSGKAKIVKSSYVLDLKTVSVLPKHAIILDPLPRIDEIEPEVDKDPRAKYFEQAGNGLYIRMALMDMVFNG